MKRFLAIILCIVLCVSMLPTYAFAEGEEDNKEGIEENNTVTINFASGGGSGDPMPAVSVARGSSLKLPGCTYQFVYKVPDENDPEKEIEKSKAFQRWVLNDKAYEAGDTYKVPDGYSADEITFTAVWDIFTVSFNMGGHGYAPETQTVISGFKAEEPGYWPQEDGWEFKGWYADSNFSSEFDFDEAIEANTVVYGKWAQRFSVTVENGTTGAATAAAGDTVTITANEAEEGEKFVAWTTNSDITFNDPNAATTSFTMPGEAVTVTATYDVAYPVTVTLGSASPEIAAVGETVTITANAAEAGKRFDVWTTESNITISDLSAATASFTMPEGAVSVTASYVDTYPVTVTNGSANAQNAAAGDTVTITANQIANQAFDSWTVNSGDIELASESSSTTTFTMPAEAVSVSAGYKTCYPITVTYGTADPQSAAAGTTVTITAIDIDNKAFDSWTVNSGEIELASETTSPTTFTMPDRMVTLTANYKNTYKVWFNLNGHGDAIDAQTVVSGEKAEEPVPYAEGWIFCGWYDEGTNTAFDFETAINRETKLAAKWLKEAAVKEDKSGITDNKEYAIALDLNFQDVADSVVVKVDGKLIDKVDQQTGKDNYTVTAGSTVVTLTTDFLATLRDGNHTMQVEASEGAASRMLGIQDGTPTAPIALRGMMKASALRSGEEDYNVEVTDGVAWDEDHSESDAKAKINTTAGKTVYIKPDPAIQFDSWSINPETTITPASSTEAAHFTMPSTIPADGVKVTALKKYVVTFEMNGRGEQVDPQYKKRDGTEKATKPDDPVDSETDPVKKAAFGGWCSDEDLKNDFDFDTLITQDTDLYARWTFRVEFTTAHVDDPADQEIAAGQKATEPTPKPASPARKFLGWYEEDSTEAFKFTETPITKNIELFGKWKSDLQVTYPDTRIAHYGSDYRFVLNCSYDEVINDGNFELKINDKTVSASNYKLEKEKKTGNTIVRLTTAYVKSLTANKTYRVTFNPNLLDIDAIPGTFSVSKAPKTGDTSNVALWAAVAGVSAVAAVVIAVSLFRRRKKDKTPPDLPDGTKKTHKTPKE